MGIKYIHPIFIFQPPKENKKQKSQSQALFLEGALHILFIRDSFSRCFNVWVPQTGKEQDSPKHKLANT